MAATTVQDHVSALLARDVALPKSSGVPNSGLEASAVFESVALNLLLKPRAALYFELLARNGLLAALKTELAQIDAMATAVEDTANLSYKIDGAPTLARARTALLSLESLPRLSANQTALTSFHSAVQTFLDKNLSKNVRRKGATSLTRPSAEALSDLPSLLTSLKTSHTDVLDRLYTLATGFDNFLSAPFSALLGNSTVSRTRIDLEDILSQVTKNGDPALARDFATRLIAGRAAVKIMASPPDPLADLALQVSTASSSAVATSTPGPWDVPVTPVIIINGSAYNFFIHAAAQFLTSEISFPLTLDSEHADLYLSVDGTKLRLPLQGTYSNNAALANQLIQQGVFAAPFGTNRLLIWVNGAQELVTLASVSVPDSTSTTGANRIYSKSAHSQLGLIIGQTGTRAVSAKDMADALNYVFPTITATANQDGTISIVSSTASLIIAASAWNFVEGTFSGRSDRILTTGLQVGDLVVLPDGSRRVLSVDSAGADLDGSVAAFSGACSGKSSLVLTHLALISRIKTFLTTWSKTTYAKNLITLDRVTAPLLASQSPAQRQDALRVLNDLKSQLTTLLNLLSETSTILPTGAASEERTVVEGILTTLTERNYDRAADRLLRCDIHALLEMDQDKASYAGTFLAATSKYAQAGNTLPNTAAVHVVR